ncbi:MAG: acyl-CoA dehydrogenase, partial [bacterium]
VEILFRKSTPLLDSSLNQMNLNFCEWWNHHNDELKKQATFIEQAILGGFSSHCLGFAFAIGYESALRKLFPTLPEDKIASFCITEEKGNHPSAIQAKLEKKGNQWYITGHKKWSTLAKESDIFLIAVSLGLDSTGRNQIRLVQVEASSEISLIPLPIGIVPEISHASLKLENFAIQENQILPDDGYKYIKQFRTIEDIHVGASTISYIFRVAKQFQWPQAIQEELLYLIQSYLSFGNSDYQSPALHIALGGLYQHQKQLLSKIDSLWNQTDQHTLQCWQRDQKLFQIAETVRKKRLERAWEVIN